MGTVTVGGRSTSSFNGMGEGVGVMMGVTLVMGVVRLGSSSFSGAVMAVMTSCCCSSMRCS